ncbi:MAG: Multimeric flavodoxin WrbA [Acidobacteriales bacterium]|nr:Multimeric flavodoxin WrbA [Terriglobales bacterium]
MKPYAMAHEALDEDKAFQEEVLNVARTLGKAVILHRSGKYDQPGKGLVDPQPK